MKKIVSFLFCIGFSYIGITQLNYYRVTLQPGFDYLYQLTLEKNNLPVDYLGNTSQHHMGIQIPVNVFINEKIGVNVKIAQASKFSSIDKDEKKLNNFLSEYYGSQYYLSEENKIQSYSSSSDIYFLSLGGVYRLIKNKWNYQFGVNVGAMKYSAPDIFYYLKEHASNNYYSVNLSTDMDKRWMLFFEPSVYVSYSLKKRLSIFIAGSYLLSPDKIRQSEYINNLYTNEAVRTEYFSSQLFHMVSAKVGLSIGIGKIINKRAAGE